MTLKVSVLMVIFSSLLIWPFHHRPPRSLPEPSRPSIKQGTVLFQRTCLSCHGPHGDGEALVLMPDGTKAPSLEGLSGAQHTLPDLDEIIDKGYKSMPGYGAVLDPNQLKSLALYVRSLSPSDAS